MKKYIILIFAVITFILSSCATGMRGYRYNDYGYDAPNRDYRNGRYKDRGYDYRYGDRDYDDYGYGNGGNYDRNYRYDDNRYNDRHSRHHHKRLKGLVIVI